MSVYSELVELVALIDQRTIGDEPTPWAIIRSYCAPREGYCVWIGEKSFFRPRLIDAVRAARAYAAKQPESLSPARRYCRRCDMYASEDRPIYRRSTGEMVCDPCYMDGLS